MAETSTTSTPTSRLDRSLSDALRWLTTERALYIGIALVALALRLWDLGARGLSFDEAEHAVYSWKLFRGEGYVHDPMMHGPVLYFLNTLMYFLFGDTDFSARLAPALVGTGLVFIPYTLRRWLSRSGALLASLMLAISPMFLFFSRYIRHDLYAATLTLIVAISVFRYLHSRRQVWVVVGGVAAVLALASMEASYIVLLIYVLYLGAALLCERLTEQQASRARLALLAIGGIGLVGVIALGSRYPLSYLHYVTLASLFLIAVALSNAAGRGREGGPLWWPGMRSVQPRTLLIALGAMGAVFVILYTTFFTNWRGLYSGAIGQIVYWLGEHKGGAGRGGQPWYYHLMQMSLYEFLPLLGAIVASIYYAVRGTARNGKRDSLPVVPFLIFVSIMSTAMFAWAGEKMPQHSLYQVLPMVLLTGRFGADLVRGIQWQALWRRGGWLAAPLLPLIVYALVRLIKMGGLTSTSLSDPATILTWIAAVAVVGLLILALVWAISRLARGDLGRLAAGVVLALLLVLTFRFSWMANFTNMDLANETIIYAHASPDEKRLFADLAEISARTVGGNQIRVAYDSESTWPIEWYMREYPNRVFYGSEPTKQTMDGAVIIADSDVENKVKSFLGSRYVRYPFRRLWWPIEDYDGATPKRILQELRDPAKRQEIWNVIWRREYKYALTEWPMVENAGIYVRKDIAAQMWQYGTSITGPAEPVVDPFEGKKTQASALLSVGQPGAEVGQLKDPRVVAVDAQGNLYVGDSGNHRVQVFGPDGRVLRQWGTEGTGPGEFSEIWGIAVDASGNVYVSDTWNYRVQKFDSQGTFLAQVGSFGESGSNVNAVPAQFYGPRAIVLDPDGNLLVADTGNKRIQKLSPNLEFIAAFGGPGILDGQFDEPTGLAVDAMGNIYVADTWNQRIQKFDAQTRFVARWDVPTWSGQSVINKPYLAVDSRGRLYASDPESFRVLQYSASGQLLAVFGEFGQGTTQLNLPIGLAVDAANRLYIVDAANNRVQVFGPVGQ